MNFHRREVINDIAYQVRNLLNITEDDFDIANVVSSLNGHISSNPFCDYEARVIKSSNKSFTIELDTNCSSKRERFSIAHELGHLFLHMKFLIDSEAWDNIEIGTSHARNSTTPYSRLESEANEFAAAFLMPKDRFISIAEETSDGKFYNMDKIANHFKVSTDTVNIRGKVLGIWE